MKFPLLCGIFGVETPRMQEMTIAASRIIGVYCFGAAAVTFLNAFYRCVGRERISFLLFFIPGTPKDLLTWAAGFINIRPLRFFAISTVARLPSILSSTLAGASLISGDFTTTVFIFILTGAVSLVGMWLHNKLEQHSAAPKGNEQTE